MFINRNYNRTEHDDFELNFAPRLGNTQEAVPMFFEQKIVGWKLQLKYE